MKLRFEPMNPDASRQFISWRYDGDYHIYNIEPDDINEEIDYLCDPENQYYAIYSGDELIGHAVFGADARVPGGDYAAEALDIGAGMRPDTTGQGQGTAVIAAILDFARETFNPPAFRATIATWNKRSQKATTNNGFKAVSHFTKTGSSDNNFVIFMRDA